MSRKKLQTYGDMSRIIADIQKRMVEEKKRMANVMAEALLDDFSAAKLGDFSDTDLRRLMSLLAGHIDECIEILEQEKLAKKSKVLAGQTPDVQQPFDEMGAITM